MSPLQEGLVWTMVLATIDDRRLSRVEIRAMRDSVGHLPVFAGVDLKELPAVAEACAEALAGENGVDVAARRIKRAVPRKMGETAYLLACDMMASDGRVGSDDVEVLDLLADIFALDSLTCAALETAARARFAKP